MRFVRLLAIFLGFAPLAAACTTVTDGTPAGSCSTYAGSTAAQCPSGTLVCGVNGKPTTCCPESTPYFCASDNTCYGSPNDAAQDCGDACQACVPVGSTGPQPDSGPSGPSCNIGVVYQPITGGQCPTMNSCSAPPYSCVTEQGIQENLKCCCDVAGTECIGCKQSETCSGQYGNSPVSCCSN